MTDPVALDRAKALLRHVKRLGAPLEEFYVPVSVDEGFELIRWFRAQAEESTTNLAVLDQDIRRAQKKGDPWIVLENVSLMGLAITRMH